MLFRKSISKEEINELPLYKYEGKINIIDDENGLIELVDNIMSGSDYIGIDTEKKPAFRKGVVNTIALVQIALKEKVYLLKVKKIKNLNPLFELLQSKEVYKVGVGLHDDVKEFSRIRKFEPISFLDLSHIAKELEIKNIGVRGLSAILLGYRISKSQQTSNWEKDPLTESQKRYAATDAWICLKLFNELNKKMDILARDFVNR